MLRDWLLDQPSAFLAWRAFEKATEDADAATAGSAIRFRCAIEDSDFNVYRSFVRGIRGQIIRRSMVPVYWPRSLAYAKRLDGADPEALLNLRLLEQWLEMKDMGRLGFWSFADFILHADTWHEPDGLVPCDPDEAFNHHRLPPGVALMRHPWGTRRVGMEWFFRLRTPR
ncbi:hypothetical protein N7I30_21185 [Aurantimonas litoralis]|nr:hypothetical protein [Aurantimonas litoralis]